jgi:2-dehydro-3-deoxyglucarate aldolase
MNNKKLKKNLKNNTLTIGSWVTISSPNIIEVLAQYDFDWLCIDIEHNMFNNESVINLIRLIQSFDIAALVRVSSNDEVIIKHCMDAGADGIVVPMVNSLSDAKKAVDSVYYPPAGKRGVGLSRAQKYGAGFIEYKEWLNESAIIIAQIEHHKAITNLEEIISLDLIDGAIIGPYDLSASMGYPGEFNRDDVQEQLEQFKSICKKANFPYGFHIVDPIQETLESKINEGYNFIAYGTDFNFLREGIKNSFTRYSAKKHPRYMNIKKGPKVKAPFN